MAFKYRVANCVPLTLQKVIQGGSNISTRVASGAGTIAFDAPTSSPVTADKYLSYSLVAVGLRHAAMISPVPGETFIATTDLRFIASGLDGNRFGGPAGSDHAAIRVEFYLNDTKVLTVNDFDNYEYNVFKGRASGIVAGTYQVWCRAVYTDFSYLDSRPFQITVIAAPSYGSTVNLNADINWSSGISYIGSVGSRIRINGNGFKWLGNPTSIDCQYVDFFNFGAISGFSSVNGIDITTSGNTLIDNCRFYNCTPINIVSNGTSTVLIDNTLFSSNSRVPLGQFPDGFSGELHGSYPCAIFSGNSSGAKSLETNNVGAAWISISSSNWTIGGASIFKSNIFLGPRVGIQVLGSFSGLVKLNYSHHIYFGGWSQGSNFEFSGTSPIIEHNVIIGSSWPNRGIEGIFRYNLVLGEFIEEGLIWTHTGAADIHHNVLRLPTPSRGIIYSIYASSGAFIRNNLIDGVNQAGANPGFYMSAGIYNLNSNLFANNPSPAVQIDGGTLTSDYNGFFNSAGIHYSDSRSPTHDLTGNPGYIGYSEDLPIDIKAVWERTLSVTSILSDARTKYKPTNSAFDAGDTAIYGANNPIGAICRSGVSNSFDLFGTL